MIPDPEDQTGLLVFEPTARETASLLPVVPSLWSQSSNHPRKSLMPTGCTLVAHAHTNKQTKQNKKKKQTNKHTNKQTNKHTHTQTNNKTKNKQTNKQTTNQPNKQTNTHTQGQKVKGAQPWKPGKRRAKIQRTWVFDLQGPCNLVAYAYQLIRPGFLDSLGCRSLNSDTSKISDLSKSERLYSHWNR